MIFYYVKSIACLLYTSTDGERSAEITLQAGEATASIRVYQLGFDRMNARYRYLEDLNHAVMSPSGKSVSYTHLAVYKRQNFSCVNGRLIYDYRNDRENSDVCGGRLLLDDRPGAG